ncbi:hypothetical protein D8B23_18215 [Verminephrobacter aporrectodeae subsp. tuberculatae]|uniref:Uncharacterized protein n=1 Tax=Verminephrobacter aporrectodeae subsp. tuberculatae TaxID=1110392 RepID=A0ABT3KQV3_9BURK|nr:hypothetical protein [Verminephrobacter aporrectodeae]MCW5320681.1 hypothetical protein [Verminephrobacter aporrectodeae subsp. tuberculatae]MCW8200286.1 hypothetical protein [Verminephrobacter aporrectodeae subsp. tuberculatae]
MMRIFADLLGLVGIMLAMLTVGIAWWAIGQWLRRRGYGERLDQLGERTDCVRRSMIRIIGPLGSLLVGAGVAISRAHPFGSKRQREVWSNLQHHARQNDRSKSSGQQ